MKVSDNGDRVLVTGLHPEEPGKWRAVGGALDIAGRGFFTYQTRFPVRGVRLKFNDAFLQDRDVVQLRAGATYAITLHMDGYPRVERLRPSELQKLYCARLLAAYGLTTDWCRGDIKCMAGQRYLTDGEVSPTVDGFFWITNFTYVIFGSWEDWRSATLAEGCHLDELVLALSRLDRPQT